MLATPHYPQVVVHAWRFDTAPRLIHSTVAKMKLLGIPHRERQNYLELTLGQDLRQVLAISREWFTVLLTPGDPWDLNRFALKPSASKARVVINLRSRYPRVGGIPTLHAVTCSKAQQIKERHAYNASAAAAFASEKSRRDTGAPPAIAFCSCLIEER